MKENTAKFWIGRIHLWLGISSGLVVFIMAITGCIYAFQAEIQDMTQPYRFVEIQQTPVLPPSTLRAIAEEQLPGKHIHAVMYNKPGRAAQVFFYAYEPEAYYYGVYLNPYTGQVLKVADLDHNFFGFILDGHFYLWLPDAVGQPVVATATLVFVAMLITGLVLWWPKNRKVSKQRFTIKWNARWRRKNYDLHNVLGFYAMVIGLVLGITGLVWGFQWFASSLYWTAGGDKTLMYLEPQSDTTQVGQASAVPIDRVWELMKREHPTAEGIEVHVPETASGPIAANAYPSGDTYWQTDYRYFDQYSLRELQVDHIYGRFANTAAADKLIRMNYDIHTGAIIGLPGKILMFFASLIIASLPITGFLIWKGRRDKEKSEHRAPAKPGGHAKKKHKSPGVKQKKEEQAQPVLP